METVLLVEGPSDVNAVRAAAGVLSVDLPEGAVIDLGGITNVRKYLTGLDPVVRVSVLHDAGETDHVNGVIGAFDRAVETFVCTLDLEDVLIRALGVPRALEVVEAEGDLAAWKTISNQPFHRGRAQDQVLRRFFGAGSGRKKRYGSLLTAALGPDELPTPLAAAVAAVTGR